MKAASVRFLKAGDRYFAVAKRLACEFTPGTAGEQELALYFVVSRSQGSG